MAWPDSTFFKFAFAMDPDVAITTTDKIAAHVAQTGRKTSDVNYVSMQSRSGFGVALLDANTGELIKLVPTL